MTRVTCGDLKVTWEGTHYAYVRFPDGFQDLFSFAWEKNKPTQLDFTEALEGWINDND